ncbi:hypothetical protein Taro_001344 [Colocasia esculenta]|uniref:BAH domain n=1 Tax=Colocasia esculenta TaxID=4460 RepID=A0A843TFM5_COLES|nr:hypothetical protein [Colocasia esculenta]
MHGREGEDRKRRRHMWPAPAPGTAATTAGAPPPRPSPSPVEAAAESNHLSPDSFLKDGREIHVGDCALFRADNSPPFIGLIRWLASGKEEHLRLGVNWLYRPTDINLAKGTLLEAAPNEVFYSFHRDEISAESLLHPCKVAFLRKGVELPTGISSFICRRVYDTTTKYLWWLSDQDYINERQEEVDQLLDKTRLEMRAVVQSGGRSPKPLNGPSSTQLLKSGCDNGQNNNTSIPSQAKGKKRGEKGDQSSEPIKQECSPKADEGDVTDFTVDNIKAEIAKITDKGGLVNNDAVEKLVNLMQLDRGERKIDLAGRALLADVIAGTDRNDCLGRFVQLRGVPLLDDWLQEAHKGKNGDGSSPKEGDKSVEELLLSLLRALDKLPVNLNALQACNIGKSVNHLRGHKNSEIQKKARSLVDAWKKRVDAEMTKLGMARLNDAKSAGSSQAVSWPGKSGFSGVSYGGNRRTASNDLAVKNAVAQPSSCKSLPVKVGHGDSIIKSSAAPSGSPKLALTSSSSVSVSTKDPQTKTGASGTAEPPMAIKEEKINGSSQTFPNDHAKAFGSSCKEESKNSTTSSMTTNRASGGSSRHRKSLNGFVGSNTCGIQKDTGLGKPSSQNRGSTIEKASVERTTDLSVAEHGSHRLVVRFPNPVRSPARTASGSSPEEPSVTGSRASSPGTSEKNEHIDRKVNVKADGCQATVGEDVKTELWQNDDMRSVVRSADDGRSSADLPDEEHKISGSPSGGDDVGMNLLASVAAGEMSKSDVASPTGSPRGNSPTTEEHCTLDDVKPKDIPTQVPHQPKDNADVDAKKLEANSLPLTLDEVQQNDLDHHMADSFTDGKIVESSQENKGMVDHKEQCPVSASVSCNAETNPKLESKSVAVEADVCLPLFSSPADAKDVQSEDCLIIQLRERRKACLSVTDGSPECKRKARCPSDENESVDCVHEKATEGNLPLDGGDDAGPSVSNNRKSDKEMLEGSSCPLDAKNVADEGLNNAISGEQQLPPVMAVRPEDVNANVDNVMVASDSADTCSETVDDYRKEKLARVSKSQLEIGDHAKMGEIKLSGQALDDKISSSVLCGRNGTGEDMEMKGIVEQHSSSSGCHEETPDVMKCEDEQHGNSMDHFNGADDDKMGDVAYLVEASSTLNSSAPTISSKLSFDLNEGFSGDEGTTVLPVVSTTPGCPFVPPETLLKSKGEPGWKGSAATSAFRAAEPRKVLEIPLGTSDVHPSDAAANKQCRLPFDLNVVDDGVLEDIASQSSAKEGGPELGVISDHSTLLRSSGWLDLDLNRADESTDNGEIPATVIWGEEVPLLSVRSASGGFPNRDASILRDFDLNNGPGLDEGAVAIPSFLPDRGDQTYPVVAAPGAQRILGSAMGNGAFGSDLYRGGSTTYIGSASGGGQCFPAVPTPLVGPAGTAAAPCVRPYLISIPEGSTSGGSVNIRKWGWQGLDLNAGPGSIDVDGRDERLPLTSRQLPVANTQAFSEEQARTYQAAGGVLKRKEPEGAVAASR